jgi:DNA-binding NarL/FixJ family response regulator
LRAVGTGALITHDGVLLERASELERLHACARAVAQTRRGRVALLYGEAGIGKTAVLRRFQATLPPRFTLLWGTCDPLFTPRPMGPLLQPTAELGGDVAELLAGEALPYDVAGALAEALRGVAPSVLVLDDLHWVDEGTLDVVRLLARQIESAGTLVVLCFRDDCLHREHHLGLMLGELPREVIAARLELTALSLSAVGELALDTTLDPGLLHARTGGNPFYVTEALATGSTQVPATVREAVLARVARLSPDARDLLDAIAVIPQRAEVWLMEAMSGGQLGALDECLHSGVLRAQGDGVMFRHELARLAIQETLPPHRAVDLHRHALAALIGNELAAVDLARLAHHAEAAGDVTAVLRYAPAAGEQAAALGAPREAERQYLRALRFGRHLPPPERALLQERLADHAYFGDQRAEASDELAETIATYRDMGDAIRQGEALLRRSRLLSCIGRFRESAQDTDEAVAVLEPSGPSPALARALSFQAGDLSETDLGEATTVAHRALSVAETVSDIESIVHASNNLGWLRVALGDEDDRDLIRRSLELAIEHRMVSDAGRAFINLANCLILLNRPDEASTVIGPGIEYTRKHGLESWLHCLLALHAQAQLRQGRWDSAAEIAADLLGDSVMSLGPQLDGRLVLGLVRARRGDPESQPLLDEARAIDLGGQAELIAVVAIACAESAWLAGRSEEVAAITDEAHRLIADIGYVPLAGELAVWRRRAGIIEQAPAVPLLEHHRLQLAGDGATAAAILRERGCAYAAALALADGDDASALRDALAQLRALGAQPAARRVARRLRELGERAIPRGPRRTTRANAAGLTARELEILPLLAEGMRNAQIAQRLVLSPKTVDHHVSAILRKLDLSSRGQVVAAASRLGLLEA